MENTIFQFNWVYSTCDSVGTTCVNCQTANREKQVIHLMLLPT